MTETHVIVDQGEDLGCVVIGEAETLTDFLRHLDSDLDVAVETDAVGSNAKSCGLTDIVQQSAPSQGWWTGMGQVFQEQQSMHEDIPFGMEFRRLLNTFHGRNLGQDFSEQASFVEQEKGAAGVAFGEHSGEFIANALARNHVNFRSEALNGCECLGLDGV